MHDTTSRLYQSQPATSHFASSLEVGASCFKFTIRMQATCSHVNVYLDDLSFSQDWLEHSCLHIVAHLTLDQVKTKLCQVFLLWSRLQHPHKYV